MQDAVLAIVKAMADAGHNAKVFETLRTPERQAFLYGFGRQYDDGRGTVSKVQDSRKGWHHYGLAVDIVQNDNSPWDAPQAFWQTLGKCAEKHGLTWGGRWKFLDLPHSQWGRCPTSPTAADMALAQAEGIEAVQAKYGAR
jgi:peptidoglycan L-alanyl-D-glutamate endopeptidase CwlK